MNNGVCMRNTETGEMIQLFENISFSEALGKVVDLRSKNDGNWYWIGKVSNHNFKER